MGNRLSKYSVTLLVFAVSVVICLKWNIYIGMFLMAVATACAIIFFNDDNDNDGNYYKLT